MRSGSGAAWHYERLKEQKCKLTRPRQVVIKALKKNSRHVSAEEIYREIRRAHPDIGLATIYRNLELLARIGVVCKYDGCDRKARYGMAERPGCGHHHHLVCRKCHSVIDYSDSIDEEGGFLRQRERKLAKKYGFAIESHSVDFLGLCRKCRT